MRMGMLALALAACGNAPGGGTADAPRDTPLPIDAPADAPVCGVRSAMRGKTSRTVHIASLDRTYIVYLPPNDDPHTPVPLVFVHHGYTMSGSTMFDITGYPALADTEHIAVAFPDGQGGPNSLGAPWNVGTGVCNAAGGSAPPNADGDDFAFLDAMRADIMQDQCIDLAHVYVTGFSMGGYFSHHAGCERTDIRAVAPHSGGTHALDQCASAMKPIIIFHGKSDPVIPDGCDDPAGMMQNIEPSAKAWAVHNGCAMTTTSTPVHNGTCVSYDGCPAGGQVTLCTFDNMVHCWAGGLGTNVYACNDYESATQLEWNFFKQHAW